ncbi:MAG: hypothetical protein ACC707_12755 [Thiohalomonadales bacterium]
MIGRLSEGGKMFALKPPYIKINKRYAYRKTAKCWVLRRMCENWTTEITYHITLAELESRFLEHAKNDYLSTSSYLGGVEMEHKRAKAQFEASHD